MLIKACSWKLEDLASSPKASYEKALANAESKRFVDLEAEDAKKVADLAKAGKENVDFPFCSCIRKLD